MIYFAHRNKGMSKGWKKGRTRHTISPEPSFTLLSTHWHTETKRHNPKCQQICLDLRLRTSQATDFPCGHVSLENRVNRSSKLTPGPRTVDFTLFRSVVAFSPLVTFIFFFLLGDLWIPRGAGQVADESFELRDFFQLPLHHFRQGKVHEFVQGLKFCFPCSIESHDK